MHAGSRPACGTVPGPDCAGASSSAVQVPRNDELSALSPCFGRIDPIAQIVANVTDGPGRTGPSGNRFPIGLPPGDGVSFDVTMPIKLAATR